MSADRNPPAILTRDFYRCGDCGSPSVQHAHWGDLNSGEPGEVFGTWCEPDACWCSRCDEAPSKIEVVSATLGMLGVLRQAGLLSIERERDSGVHSAALVRSRDGAALIFLDHAVRPPPRCIAEPDDSDLELLRDGDLSALWRSERAFELTGAV